jgi:Cyclin, N-terminal domain
MDFQSSSCGMPLILQTKKRPSTDFIETIQTDINPSMRAILVDWLVEVIFSLSLSPPLVSSTTGLAEMIRPNFANFYHIGG